MEYSTSTRWVLKSLLLLGSSALACASAARAQERTAAFDVPAQSARTGIPEFAREANVQILVSEEDVDEKQTNPIRGMLPVHDALNQLLAGTGITIRSDNGRTILLTTERAVAPTEQAASQPSAATDRAATQSAALAMQAQAQPFTQPTANAPQTAQVQVAQNAQGQEVQTAAASVPEQVLVTGSLIHGTAVVGPPVTNLGTQDVIETGSVTLGDLFKTVPAAVTIPSPIAAAGGNEKERLTTVNLRGLNASGPRSLLMIDGVRQPGGGDDLAEIDPSIIPALAVDRVDVLADGASATYGTDAVVGVINVILKRGYDGATTLLHYQQPDAGGQEVQASQLWGRTWDGGDVTLTYEFVNDAQVAGTAHSNNTVNYTPWGLPNMIKIQQSVPGTITVGAPAGMAPGSIGTVCSNCWAIPHGTGQNFNASLNNGLGPLAPSSAAPFNWQTFTANPANTGTNEVNPLALGWEDAAQQKNSFVATFDQRLFPGASLFGTAFDSNRRSSLLEPPYANGSVDDDIRTVTVPTTNPYYPTNAPSNLRVSYDFGQEVPLNQTAEELSYRYEVGLNLDLPFDWTGQIFYARSFEKGYVQTQLVNNNSIEAALGSTVDGIAKPASVPYLNVFCDATVYKCNSPTTLAYIASLRAQGAVSQLSDRQAHFDGPLFQLPGGQVKAAIGGEYLTDDAVASSGINAGGPPGATFVYPSDSEPYNIWAGFAQIDIPIFGDDFNFPLFRKLDVEISGRHDSYSGTLQGSVNTPKAAFTWLLDDTLGATIRGDWGTAFRFPTISEYSALLSDSPQAYNLPSGTTLGLPCAGAAPTAGSVAADLFRAGFACGSAVGGINWENVPSLGLRSFVNAATGQTQTREGGPFLGPETSINYSLGFELAPQIAFLRGLDVQATWWSVKINNQIGTPDVPETNFQDPFQRSFYILPSDLGCPVADNAAPTLCAAFEKMALAAVTDPNSTVSTSDLSNVYWLEDGGTTNLGFIHESGIDWNASYDVDAGDFGAWNVGVVGTYYLNRNLQAVPGGEIVDAFHADIGPAGGIPQVGVETTPRMIYRARLGWSDDAFSVTGFMNYQSHYFATSGVPSNVNFQCTAAGGSVGGGTFPCAISNYTNYEPDFVTFDLSLGYNTGERPANDYLKHITLQLVIQNLLDKHSPFEYGPSISGRNPSGYDPLASNLGRILGITLLKNW